LFAVFKHSNSTFIILYLYHEMVIDYLVVDEMANISKLFDHNCMLRIGCNPMMLITYTWLITCLKVFKLVDAGFCIPYHLKPLHVQKSNHLVTMGQSC
jgi:hypothetical protein